MSGTLFVVATPLGNMEDVTFRAIRVLREVDLIAAEDTRRTARLLSHYGISTPSVSFHQHNVRTRLPQLLSRLEAGKSVALVTDAGTPRGFRPGCRARRRVPWGANTSRSHPRGQRAPYRSSRIRVPPHSADYLRVSPASVKRQNGLVFQDSGDTTHLQLL